MKDKKDQKRNVTFTFFGNEYQGEVEEQNSAEVKIDGQWYPRGFIWIKR